MAVADEFKNISDDQFRFVCAELMKYGLLDEYLFKKAIEELCVNDVNSLIDQVSKIKHMCRIGDSINKQFIEGVQ